ncbi:hypothetical protein [Musicola paradisiaca]|uniref:Uncharacterized protein n=1 Tax=Musicola paradisiaca (strain Ech703) TaxID=579405 RepID=C6CAS3_MUSP7|nr:hypothetical protein [Musicola paradisiaca]ACS84623.1 hypothetical protein Dd703_0812 [Musicola paradisiaca Ech703]
MYVFRIHIRPHGGSATLEDTFNYCINNGVLGVGWQVELTPASWDAYLQEAEKIHDNLQIPKYIKRWVSEGDLVWTRNAKGMYYLAKVKSGWEYWMGAEAMEKDIDIANIFRVDIVPVSLDAVPGKVIACFRPARTMQEIASGPAVEYSKYLWNKLTDRNDYDVDHMMASDIFELLDDEETEDLVFLYMQAKGWFIVPNSRKKDTMSFEFYAIDPQTGSRALTQVKTGSVELNQDDYAEFDETVFLFQSKENYSGASHSNVFCIKRRELLDFMHKSYSWLPSFLKQKIDMSKMLSG